MAAVERRKRLEAETRGTVVTLNDAAGDYWAIAKTQTNWFTTEYQIDRLLEGFGKDTVLEDISDRDVASYVSHARGRKTAKGFVSPASVNREVELLRRIMNRARLAREAHIRPINWKVHKLKEAGPRDRVLSYDEEDRLLATLAGHLRDPMRFALMTGLRKSNVFGLDWAQVNLRDRVIQFRIKGDKPFTLPITGAMLALLARQGTKEAGRVFRYRGDPISSFKTAWRAALRRAGIENFTWHDLRHTVATRLVMNNDISEVQEVLGHADMNTTRRYVHHQEGVKRKVLESLDYRLEEQKDG